MDEREAAKLKMTQALQEHADAVEAFAKEANAIAELAEGEGALGFANALRELARAHRAAIQYQARGMAMRGDPPPGGERAG
jgi:hypothetical protein